MKKRKAGVRSPRAPARPTRGKPSPKLREGRRQPSPFHTEWKYLDLSSVGTSPKKAGGGSHRSSGAGNAYYKSPKPWQSKTDREVLKWYHEQDDDYRRRIVWGAEQWEARVGGAWTEETLIVAYLRKMGAPPCSCGFDGSPRSLHSLSYQCLKTPSPYAESWANTKDDDDDIPF